MPFKVDGLLHGTDRPHDLPQLAFAPLLLSFEVSLRFDSNRTRGASERRRRVGIASSGDSVEDVY
jgi:hypothetical protein